MHKTNIAIHPWKAIFSVATLRRFSAAAKKPQNFSTCTVSLILPPISFSGKIHAVISFAVGWGAAMLYARQAHLDNYQSFRWVLLLLSMVHCVLLDVLLSQINHINKLAFDDIYSSILFVIGLAISWATNLSNPQKGNVVDGELTDFEKKIPI